MDPAAVLARLALGARGREQPMVPDRAIVQAARARRLGQRDRAGPARARPLRSGGSRRERSATVSRRTFVQLAADARARTASAIRANTPGQSPAFHCRNTRVAGYHGLSSDVASHRTSWTC